MMHFLENTGGAPTLCAASFETSVITTSGERIITKIHPHMPGLARNYEYAIELLEKVGGVQSAMIGNARCELYSSRLLRDVAYKALAENPCAFIHVFNHEDK